MVVSYQPKQKNHEMGIGKGKGRAPGTSNSQGWARGQGKLQGVGKKIGGLARSLYHSGAVNDKGWERQKKWDGCVDMVKSWRRQQRGMKIIGVDMTVEELEASFRGSKGNLRAYFGDDFTLFDVIKSRGKEHVAIVDREGVVLGYRKTVAPEMVERLGRAAEALPVHAPHPRGATRLLQPADATPAAAATGLGATTAPGAPAPGPEAPAPGRVAGQCPGSRGVHRAEHLALWADYISDSKPFISYDNRWLDDKHQGAGRKFIEENRDLVKMVTNDHRHMAPQEHARGLVAAEKIKKEFGIEPLFQGWFGAAIVQGMSGEEASEMHRDMRDYGLTCLVPFGEFSGGDLVLVQLGLKVELRPGFTFFFRSSIIAHQVGEVMGTRGVLTLFTHANVFAWADRTTALERDEWEKKKEGLKFKKRGRDDE